MEAGTGMARGRGRSTELVSVRLPAEVAYRVRELAEETRQSVNRVMADLVAVGLRRQGLEARVEALEHRTGVK